jgi:hypothetical protein
LFLALSFSAPAAQSVFLSSFLFLVCMSQQFHGETWIPCGACCSNDPRLAGVLPAPAAAPAVSSET